MKIIKRNQLTILVLSLMLVTAGYLNYTTKSEEIETSAEAVSINEVNVAGIGDAKLVNSNDIVENTIQEAKITEEEQENLVENTENDITTNNTEETNEVKNETITTNALASNNNQYFANSRLEREKMYSQMVENYQRILENTSISNEQKAIAQNEIDKISKTKNAIMISENLIKTKGIEDCVIFINEKNINVIVKKDELLQEDIAQIQNIISRELEADLENIHIMNK